MEAAAIHLPRALFFDLGGARLLRRETTATRFLDFIPTESTATVLHDRRRRSRGDTARSCVF
jgi:hypothetical protein